MQAIFDNILSRNITWPEEMSPQCRDCIECLLTMDPAKRLGRRGAGEVRASTSRSQLCQPSCQLAL